MRRLAWHRVYADTDNEYKDLEPYGIAISSPWLAKTGDYTQNPSCEVSECNRNFSSSTNAIFRTETCLV
jgi:hypothetical protein